MDKFTKKKRSEIMAKIHSKDTKFERDFRVILKRSINKKFETNVAKLKGKPDMVFAREKLCVFLDSDFWHGWQYPRWKSILNDFWREKIEGNRGRDRKTTAYLRKNNWRVVRIWEHEIIKDRRKTIQRVVKALSR